MPAQLLQQREHPALFLIAMGSERPEQITRYRGKQFAILRLDCLLRERRHAAEYFVAEPDLGAERAAGAN